MSLDQNLFTLHLAQSKDDPRVVDLVDPAGMVHYRKQRLPGPEYKIELYDPLSASLLATATAPAPTSKAKVLELRNPAAVVELKYTGTLSFRWGFKWEDFEWKREECFMLRKPDPPVLVALTKEPAGRIKSAAVQILDYNLNRFDIADRKGLEIVILTALLTFQDASDTHHAADPPAPAVLAYTAPAPAPAPAPPAPPPKPAPATGAARIRELQRGAYNEVTVGEEGGVAAYAEHCAGLIRDEAILFVTLRAAGAAQVPKVLQVVEQTKRIRHKEGLADGEELHQYVIYDERPRGPKRIVLDDGPRARYAPPEALTVHLSKIDMPELQPRVARHERVPSDPNFRDVDRDKDKDKDMDRDMDKDKGKGSKGKGRDKDKDRAKAKDSDAKKKDAKKDERKAAAAPPPAPTPEDPRKLNKPRSASQPSSTPPPAPAHSHTRHPSTSTAPAPRAPSPGSAHRHHSYSYRDAAPAPALSLYPASYQGSAAFAFPMPHVPPPAHPSLAPPPLPNAATRPQRNSFHSGAKLTIDTNVGPGAGPHGLAIPPWQPPAGQNPGAAASSLVGGLLDRLQVHRR